MEPLKLDFKQLRLFMSEKERISNMIKTSGVIQSRARLTVRDLQMMDRIHSKYKVISFSITGLML